jgi:hypothetical protein
MGAKLVAKGMIWKLNTCIRIGNWLIKGWYGERRELGRQGKVEVVLGDNCKREHCIIVK